MFGLFGNRDESAIVKVDARIEYDFHDVGPFIGYIKAETGISFDNQRSILKSKLSSFCRTHAIDSFDSCRNQIETNADLKQTLINYLTTNESFFYREFTQISKLVDEVKTMSGVSEILCLPCSTGEEPYSIAIALLEAGIAPAKFNLLGVDISTDAVCRAKQGVYNQRNVSKVPPALVDKYFDKFGKSYCLSESIKMLVRFETGNLFSNAITRLGCFDFVLSRNMLIYFDAETKARASMILASLLKNPSNSVRYGHADLY